MTTNNITNTHRRFFRFEPFDQYSTWLICILIIGCNLGLQKIFFGPGVFTKHLPVLGLPSFGMMLLSLIGGLLIAYATIRNFNSANCALDKALQGRVPLGLALTFILLAGTAFGLAFYPTHLPHFVLESRLLSYVQELFLIVAVVSLATTAMLPGKTTGFRALCGAMLATVLFIFLEEISYGQHYFGWETGDFFADNKQNETNLHNFYTHAFEMSYYIGAIVCFIWLPIALTVLRGPWIDWAKPYVPSAWFAVIAFPISANLYMDWQMAAHQFAFFASSFLIVLFLLKMHSDAQLKPMLLAGWGIVMVTLCVQLLYFVQGHLLWDRYESQEIKETHIALALMLYGLWLFQQHRGATSPARMDG